MEYLIIFYFAFGLGVAANILIEERHKYRTTKELVIILLMAVFLGVAGAIVEIYLFLRDRL